MVENNENDDITLVPGINPADPLRSDKEKLLGPSCLSQRMRVGKNTDDTKFQKFMSYLRFVTFSGSSEEFEAIFGNVHDVKKLSVSPLSLESEKAVLSLLTELATSQIKKYPETLREDIEILKRSNLTYNEKNCILFRASEKQTLASFIELAEKGTRLLNGEQFGEDEAEYDPYYMSIQHLVYSKMSI